jgi:hypothetical protein
METIWINYRKFEIINLTRQNHNWLTLYFADSKIDNNMNSLICFDSELQLFFEFSSQYTFMCNIWTKSKLLKYIEKYELLYKHYVPYIQYINNELYEVNIKFEKIKELTFNPHEQDQLNNFILEDL